MSTAVPPPDPPLDRAAASEPAVLRERAARYAAECALAIRDATLGYISHDLRGPLNAIQSWSYVLESRLGANPVDQDLQRGLGAIRSAVARQTQLLEASIDGPRAAARARPLNRRRLACDTLLEHSAELARIALGEARATVIETARSGVIDLEADSEQLAQAVWAMLVFAIDASAPHSAIALSCLAHAGALQLAARVALADSAPGELNRRNTAEPMVRFNVEFVFDGQALRSPDLPHAYESHVREAALAPPRNPSRLLALALCERVAGSHRGQFSHDSLTQGERVRLVLTVPRLP